MQGTKNLRQEHRNCIEDFPNTHHGSDAGSHSGVGGSDKIIWIWKYGLFHPDQDSLRTGVRETCLNQDRKRWMRKGCCLVVNGNSSVDSAAALISQCQNKYGKSRVIVPKVTDKVTNTQKSLFLTTHQRIWPKVDESHEGRMS